MTKPLLVVEDVRTRRPILRAFGVSWWATRYAWVAPLCWVGLGLAVALAERRRSDGAEMARAALWYGAVLYAANILHSLGHVVAGRYAGSPVEMILATSTRDVVIYAQPGSSAPARGRLGRSLGGPLANMAVGCCLVLGGHLTHASWVVTGGLMNVCVAVWTLMPVPSLDGWVIWATLTRSRIDDAA